MSRTIGSSQVAAVLGLSPWASPLDVWQHLAGEGGYDQATGGPLLRGQLLEPGLRDWYAREVGLPVTPGPTLDEPGWPVGRYGHARPDAHHPDEEGGIVTVEIKTADWRTKADWADGIPAYYLAQVLWEMASRAPGDLRITGARVVGYVVDDAPRVYSVERNARREAALLARVESWYERHILGGEPVHNDSAASRAAWHAIAPVDKAVTVEPTDADREMLAAWRAAKRAEKAAAADRRALEAQLGARIGSAAGIAGELSWDPVKARTTINGKALAKAHPDIFARFSKTGQPSRRFRDLTQTDEPDSSEES